MSKPNYMKALEAMQAEPDRVFTKVELVKICNGFPEATGVALGRFKKCGLIENSGYGLWQAVGVGDRDRDLKPAKAKPSAAPESPELEEDDPAANEDAERRLHAVRIGRKLLWAIDGFEQGFLTPAELRAITRGEDVVAVLG